MAERGLSPVQVLLPLIGGARAGPSERRWIPNRAGEIDRAAAGACFKSIQVVIGAAGQNA